MDIISFYGAAGNPDIIFGRYATEGMNPQVANALAGTEIFTSLSNVRVNKYELWFTTTIAFIPYSGETVFLTDVSGNVTHKGDLLTRGNATVEKDTTLKGNAIVEKDVDVKGTLKVAKEVNINQNTKMDRDLRVEGDLYVRGQNIIDIIRQYAGASGGAGGSVGTGTVTGGTNTPIPTPSPSPEPPPYSFFTERFKINPRSQFIDDTGTIMPVVDFGVKTYDKNLQTLIENSYDGIMKSYVTSRNDNVIKIKIPQRTKFNDLFVGKLFDFKPGSIFNLGIRSDSTIIPPELLQFYRATPFGVQKLTGGKSEDVIYVDVYTPERRKRVNPAPNPRISVLDKNGDDVYFILKTTENLDVGTYKINVQYTRPGEDLIGKTDQETNAIVPSSRTSAIIEITVAPDVLTPTIELPASRYSIRTDLNREGKPLVVPTTFRPVIPTQFQNDTGLYDSGVIDFVQRQYDESLKNLIESTFKGSVRLYITKQKDNVFKIQVPRGTDTEKTFKGVYLVQPKSYPPQSNDPSVGVAPGFESRIGFIINTSDSGVIDPNNIYDVIIPAGSTYTANSIGDYKISGSPQSGVYAGLTLYRNQNGQSKPVLIFSYDPFNFDIFEQQDFGQSMNFKLKTTKELDPGKYVIKIKTDIRNPPVGHETGDSVGVIEVNVV